jgi:hypothetical protein
MKCQRGAGNRASCDKVAIDFIAKIELLTFVIALKRHSGRIHATVPEEGCIDPAEILRAA